MLKQKTPLRRKTPLTRRTPLRAKGIKRDAPRLTIKKAQTWAKTTKGAEYLAKENAVKTKARENYTAAGWNNTCAICGKPIMDGKPFDWHHWIWKRSEVRGYRFLWFNLAPVHRWCHIQAHKDKAAYNLARRMIYTHVVDKIMPKETIQAIYCKEYKITGD